MLQILLATVLAQAAPPVTTPASCTAQYRAQPHQTQAGAKTFGRTCLIEQGAKPRQVTAAEVDRLLLGIVHDDDPLTHVVPADVASFCPRYAALAAPDRARFWRRLLGAIVKPESGYNTAALYWEPSTPAEYSIGLLQLSLINESHYHCGMKSEADLTDAAFNLRCGAIVMRERVSAIQPGEQPRIGGDGSYKRRFAARYWSTLQDRSTAPAGAPAVGARGRIIATARATPGCSG